MRFFQKIIICTFFWCLYISVAAQVKTDSGQTTGVNKDSSQKAVPPVVTEKKPEEKKPADSATTAASASAACCACSGNIKPIGWILVLSPVILLLIAFYYFLNRMKKDKFSLASALSAGTETRKNIVSNADGTKTEMEYTENIGSASRTIAFFTGITAIIIACCLTTFQGYKIIAGCSSNAADFDGLWKILGALGIGVIPYGINVWNRNAKEQ
jgi:hypothetical protein